MIGTIVNATTIIVGSIIGSLLHRGVKEKYKEVLYTGLGLASLAIGLNKVAQTVEAALARARSTASPINAARFDIKTPCQIDGVCHNCNSADSICNYVHFLRNSPKGRHTVVLVGESLGY